MRDIKDVLVDMLERRMISNAKLAARIGITPKQLHGTLNGKRRLDIETMFKICDTAGIDPNDLWSLAHIDKGSVENDDIK